MIVVDASTLILLAKTELLDLFLENFPTVPFISAGVEREATRKESFDALFIRERAKEKKIVVKKVKNQRLVKKIAADFKLHFGEAETLALCIENSWRLVGTDDFNAIKACIVLQIEYASAMDILSKLNKEKKLSKAGALAKLRKLAYFWGYNEEIINEVKDNLR